MSPLRNRSKPPSHPPLPCGEPPFTPFLTPWRLDRAILPSSNLRPLQVLLVCCQTGTSSVWIFFFFFFFFWSVRPSDVWNATRPLATALHRVFARTFAALLYPVPTFFFLFWMSALHLPFLGHPPFFLSLCCTPPGPASMPELPVLRSGCAH